MHKIQNNEYSFEGIFVLLIEELLGLYIWDKFVHVQEEEKISRLSFIPWLGVFYGIRKSKSSF